jgi:hypothetical protein
MVGNGISSPLSNYVSCFYHYWFFVCTKDGRFHHKNAGYPGAAQPQPNFLYESGEIASEKAPRNDSDLHFDGTLHVSL